MNSKVGTCLVVSAGAAGVAGLLYFAFAPVEDAQPLATARETVADESVASGGAERRIDEVSPAKVAQTTRAVKRSQRPQMKAPEDWFAKLPTRDRAIAQRIQDAQDADNRENVLKAAEAALGSSSTEVREAAVEALKMQGEDAIPLLLKYVTDKNDDVAEAAYNAWDDAVDGFEHEHKKLEAITTILPLIRSDEQIKSAVEKIAALDRSLAISELTKLALAGGRTGEAAKESYETLTGVSFEDRIQVELEEAVNRVDALKAD